MSWSGGFAEWTDGDTAYLSIAFTWLLDKAYSRAIWYRALGYKVKAGGPALFLNKMKHEIVDVCEVGGDYPDALARHNPDATIASRGCPGMGTEDAPNPCNFCIVPPMEGTRFTLIPDFPVRPVLCDNNLSALPVDYQNYIIERYESSGIELKDANSGFEPRTFDGGTYERWRQINRGPWRFGYDMVDEAEPARTMMHLLRNEPAKLKRVYVLIGNEPFDECMGRIRNVIEWGGEPHVQPYIKLAALEKRPHVRFDWTEQKLRDVARWANGFVWRSAPFDEYDRSRKNNVREPIYDAQQGLFI